MDKHEHAYTPTQSKMSRVEGETITVVLLHCACGDFNHARIPGEWTFEEITRKPGTMKSDAEILKEMGIVPIGVD